METTREVHVFDFDGVLAHPYTHPELLVPGVERLLRALNQQTGTLVMVASFNPRAYTVLQDLYEGEALIAEMRAGSNHAEWWRPGLGDGVYSDEAHRIRLSKAEMIAQMLEKRGFRRDGDDGTSVFFYDDDPKNISDVQLRLPHVKCHLIKDSGKGLLPHYEEWFSHVFS